MAKDVLDLKAAFTAEATKYDGAREIRVTDGDGEPYKDEEGKPAVWFIYSEYAEKMQEFDRRETKRAKRALMAGQTDENDSERWIARLATAVAGWRHAIGGKNVPHSYDNAVTILTAAPWIRKQVAMGMTLPASFSKGNSGA